MSDTQQQQNTSVEIYTITYLGNTFKLTTYYKDVLISGENFKAEAAMQRGSLQYRGDNSETKLRLTISINSDLAVILKASAEINRVSIAIYSVYLVTPFTKKYLFVGDCAGGVGFSEGLCTITFSDALYKVKRTACRTLLQAGCNNTLFDYTCTVAKTADVNFVTATNAVISEDGYVLTSTKFAFPEGSFANGKAYFNGVYRGIVSSTISGTTGSIRLQYPFNGLNVTNTIIAYFGCDKRPETCQTRFDNLNNFVGMPYIPSKDARKNPFTNSSAVA